MERSVAFLYLYHGACKLSNQIAQFPVNIFDTHLLQGEQMNHPCQKLVLWLFL